MKALLSVFDKIGIVEFASDLHELGWELLSSGGTVSYTHLTLPTKDKV